MLFTFTFIEDDVYADGRNCKTTITQFTKETTMANDLAEVMARVATLEDKVALVEKRLDAAEADRESIENGFDEPAEEDEDNGDVETNPDLNLADPDEESRTDEHQQGEHRY